MYNLNMQQGVQNLLNSNVQSKIISKESGVNESVISKLRNGSQQINETKHGYINNIYKCYVNHKKEIEAQIGVPDYILSEKLPISVRKFLDELSFSVAAIQQQKSSRINKVYVYDEYNLNDEGSSKEKISYIVVSEIIPINRNGDVYPYHISITNTVSDRKNIKEIKNLKISFNKEELEIVLKRYKHLGAKIKIVKTEKGGLTIKVSPSKEDIVIQGIESNYFDIQYQDNYSLHVIQKSNNRTGNEIRGTENIEIQGSDS
ncbi:hypothetical protein M4L90_12245 [Staphylococcus equorum]|uniref:Uncharacterized protein n=1 Tax=Staphylococcus equorum TaxID=246432 RepID=A0A9X4QZP1_9STAP|nr:hypothetical protein [Staphylococcus equorum]MDG0820690.1 hypothetical protein [Staphylococcus equorum]MDG0841315.1 hypothetical protein [Staphylococcus equorum]MDG0847015.1 hypothetical protein [Staphylococcus equorum]